MFSTNLVTGDELLAMGTDAPYELIKGELCDLRPASAQQSEVAVTVAADVVIFNRIARLGRVAGADGGFFLQHDPDTVVSPDIGFIRKERTPVDFDFQHFYSVPPDLAVEVVSEFDDRPDVLRRIAMYIEAGVSQFWVISMHWHVVEVFVGEEPVDIRRVGDDLDGGEVLPGFRLPVARIFADPLAE